MLQTNEKLLQFLQLFLLTIILAELVTYFLTNIRIGRYYIYLVPFFVYALLEWVKESEIRLNLKLAFSLMTILFCYHALVLRPWRTYEWDDQNVAGLKSYLKHLPQRELVICANAFQLDYYFQQQWSNCTDVALRLHLNKKSFYLFDLTGNDRMLMIYLLNSKRIDKYQKFNRSIFVSVTHPDA
ncbi:MAG: hypothetical protein H0V66_15475 [Bdellovibrionales bacterium]|nr:hypothetical protein [Bdellovibrionales bacterium]